MSNHIVLNGMLQMTKKNLLERRFGSVLGAWCIIRIVVSKIVWKIDFIEIIICGSGHRIRPRSSRHVSILFFFVAINLSCKMRRESIMVKCKFLALIFTHVPLLSIILTYLKLKFLEIWWPSKAIMGSWRESRIWWRSCCGLRKRDKNA